MNPPGGLQARVAKRLGAFSLDLELEVAPAGVTALFGASGAGKTQTLSAIAGAARPDTGRIVLDGEVLFDREAGVDLAVERRAIGWVFQDGRLFPHLNVEANLRYGARRARGRDAGVRFDELIETLGIVALLDRRPATLSGGERQRVAIGRALLAQPRLLLMDEPLAALDTARRAEILPYLERLKTVCRLPILYVTHALSEVVRLADRLAVIEAGRLRAQGPLAQVLGDPHLALTARPQDAVSVLDGRVEGLAQGLCRVRVGEATVLVAGLDRPVGAAVRVAVLARDVLLANGPPGPLSARNVLPGRIEALAERDGGDSPGGEVVVARVRLDGGPPLLCALTRDAVASLQLAPGAVVFAIVKSLAVEGAGEGGLLDALER